MNIAIIDDETHCIESLVIHLETLFPTMNIVYKNNKAYEALDQIASLNVDLLFLDIEMPGLNGFQFLEQLPERKFDVIFTTAYSQYAVKAFKARAIDYLLKPIDEQELRDALSGWQKSISQRSEQHQNIDKLIDTLKKNGHLASKISVPVSDGFEFIEVDNILYCKSQSNYTTLYLLSGEKLLISKTLKDVENTLEKFFFIRVHQSYLINPNYLKKFSRSDGGYLIMQNNEQIPISHRKRSLVTDLFKAIEKGDS